MVDPDFNFIACILPKELVQKLLFIFYFIK